MMKTSFLFHKHLLCLILTALLWSTTSHAENRQDQDQQQAPPRPLQVLFIGNSYTLYNQLPRVVKAMADEAYAAGEIERTIEVSINTHGGWSFEKHWNNEKSKAQQKITEGQWDVVVLQEYSRGTLDKLDSFKTYSEKFVELIKQQRNADGKPTVPMFYLTWARAHLPEDQATITREYLNQAKKLGADVAPVGIAWEQSLKQHPDIQLHLKDRSHPTMAGTYLGACVFYTKLTGHSPVGRLSYVEGHNYNTKGDVLVDIELSVAQKLQYKAWTVYKMFQKQAQKNY